MQNYLIDKQGKSWKFKDEIILELNRRKTNLMIYEF